MWQALFLLALVAFTTAHGYGCGADCYKGYTDKDLKDLGYRKWSKGMRTCHSYGFKGCYYGWHNPPCSGSCTGCGTIGCGLPTVYQFIASQPELSVLKQLVDTLGLQSQLDGPFNGTLFLPNNEAMTEYLARFEFDVTDPTYAPYLANFLSKLLSYHRLPRRYYAAQLVNGKFYPTFYLSANGYPHRLQFFSTNCAGCNTCGCSSCGPCDSCSDPRYRRYKSGKYAPKTIWGGKSKGGKWGGKGNYQCLVNLIRDEQGNDVTFDKVDRFVLGGGVVHTVNEVLQPNDIYPSITAVVTEGIDTFSDLLAAIKAVTAVDVLELLETTPGNLAAPINAAFAGINIDDIDPTYLLQILAYHFCPVTTPADLLLTPYKGSANNPCTTLLSTLVNWNKGLEYVQLPWTDFGRVPTRQINFFNQNDAKDKATIIVADVSTPLHVLVAIDKVMLPPPGLQPRRG